MKERPLIVTTELIPKILDGSKTQTCRVIKPQPTKPKGTAHDWEWKPAGMLCYDDYFRGHAPNYCPYGQVGDRLWVRETWCTEIRYDHLKPSEIPRDAIIYYKVEDGWLNRLPIGGRKTRSPRFMPRWASRITLEITDIRVERLQEITSWDIEREGLPYKVNRQDDAHEIHDSEIATVWFQGIWDSLNAGQVTRKSDMGSITGRGYSWESNPWVWVIEFMQI